MASNKVAVVTAGGSGMGAAAVDDFPDAGGAERAHRRIDDEAAGPSRPVRIPVLLIAKLFMRHRIGRVLREGGAVRARMPDEDETGVERQVQPFVPVRRP